MGLLIRSKISKFLGNLILKENLQLLPSGRLFGIYLQKLRGIVWNDIVLPNIALFCWKVLHRADGRCRRHKRSSIGILLQPLQSFPCWKYRLPAIPVNNYWAGSSESSMSKSTHFRIYFISSQNRGLDSLLKDLWNAGFINILWAIWLERNSVRFENWKPSATGCKIRIMKWVSEAGIRFLWIERDAQVLTEIIHNDMVSWTMVAR